MVGVCKVSWELLIFFLVCDVVGGICGIVFIFGGIIGLLFGLIEELKFLVDFIILVGLILDSFLERLYFFLVWSYDWISCRFGVYL